MVSVGADLCLRVLFYATLVLLRAGFPVPLVLEKSLNVCQNVLESAQICAVDIFTTFLA